MYVELKTGYNDNGPAWIGMAFFSRSGESVYFNGSYFLKGERNSPGNHLEMSTGDKYWISGVKKNGEDRHWAGGGKIQIDKGVVEQYLALTKLEKLPAGRFAIVELNNVPTIKGSNELENQKLQ